MQHERLKALLRLCLATLVGLLNIETFSFERALYLKKDSRLCGTTFQTNQQGGYHRVFKTLLDLVACVEDLSASAAALRPIIYSALLSLILVSLILRVCYCDHVY